MQQYLPEGYAPPEVRHWSREALQQVSADCKVIQAPVLFCDEAYGLHIDLFPHEGIIPFPEVSLESRDGRQRAQLVSRLVGKSVAFRAIGRLPDGRWLLSRAEAQREARSALLSGLRIGDVLPAIATAVTSYGAFCDIGCGLSALLGIENMSVSRTRHASERVYPGQRLFVVASQIDCERGRISLSRKELLGTWYENAAKFYPGQTVRGTVRGIRPYGVFVELTPNLSGLAEPSEVCRVGDTATVFIKSVLPQRRKIKLTLLHCSETPLRPSETEYFITEGNVSGWSYSSL